LRSSRGRAIRPLFRLSAHANELPGDQIKGVDGQDQTEVTNGSTTRKVAGPGDPEFSLSVARHIEAIIKGAVSGEVAGIRFVPTGRVKMSRTVALTFDDGPRRHIPADPSVAASRLRSGDLLRDWRASQALPEHRSCGGSVRHGRSGTTPAITPKARTSSTWQLGACARRSQQRTPSWLASVITPICSGRQLRSRLIAIKQAEGLRVVLWDVDPRDWAPGATAREIARAVLGSIKPGAIIRTARRRGRSVRVGRGAPDIRSRAFASRPCFERSTSVGLQTLALGATSL
jgi:hypothetical protein